MAFTINGIGSTYYGCRPLLDGSYVTTKWAVILFIPLFPLGSFRVVQASPVWGGVPYSRQTLTGQRVSLDWRMVIRAYGLMASLPLALGALGLLKWVADRYM